MNKQLLELAEQAQPELMQKTAMNLALIEKISPEYMEEACAGLEEISTVTMEKSAGISPVIKDKLFNAAGIAGTALAVGLGTSIATDMFDWSKRVLTKGRNFKRIMNFDPSLKEVPASGRKTLKNTFDMLHRYAPDFTADPVLGSGLLRSLVNVPVGGEREQIEKLIGARKNLLDIKDKNFKVDFKPPRKEKPAADEGDKGNKGTKLRTNE